MTNLKHISVISLLPLMAISCVPTVAEQSATTPVAATVRGIDAYAR